VGRDADDQLVGLDEPIERGRRRVATDDVAREAGELKHAAVLPADATAQPRRRPRRPAYERLRRASIDDRCELPGDRITIDGCPKLMCRPCSRVLLRRWAWPSPSTTPSCDWSRTPLTTVRSTRC